MSDAAGILKDLVTAMVVCLVDDEGAVEIAVTVATSKEPTILFVVDVAKDDVGKVIGRAGKTASAMRHILGASSRKLKVRSILEIPDKQGE